MATSVSSVVQHFPEAENGFTTTTAGSVSSGAATVTLNSVAGYTNGEPVVLVIDPTDASKKQTFTGIIDTAGVQVTDVVWTAGTNQTHALGATVVDYATATHISMMSKGIKVNHTQKGNHKTLTDDNGNEWIKQTSTASAVNEVTIANAATGTGPTISATGGDTNVDLNLTAKGTGSIKYAGRNDAWNTGVTVPNTVTYNGNRSYDLVVNSTDLTGYLSAGMRLRTTRTSAAPTQCTSLNGTTQYWSKSSPNKLTFTDDFVVSAWIKLSSYPSTGVGSIASRNNGTSGWLMDVTSTGQVLLAGYNGGLSNVSYVQSYQSVPLNKWVHVTAQLDMSTFTATTTTSYVMFDGLDVPASVARGGTNPTALVQAGDLNIGSYNAGAANSFFPGKIAQVAIYNAKVTQANIRATISQGLTGSETSLASAYSFNNAVTDLNTSTPNDLSAVASATATNADSPFGGQADGTISSTLDYAEILSTSFSTNTTLTVRVPDGNTIPTTGGVSAMSYSTQANPYGCPVFSNVLGEAILGAGFSTSSATQTQVLGLTCTVTIPAGRKIRVTTFTNALSNSSVAANVIGIWDGTVASGTLITQGNNNTSTTATPNAIAMIVQTPTLSPAAGSKTYNVGLSASAGTATFNAGATTLGHLRVELV